MVRTVVSRPSPRKKLCLVWRESGGRSGSPLPARALSRIPSSRPGSETLELPRNAGAPASSDSPPLADCTLLAFLQSAPCFSSSLAMARRFVDAGVRDRAALDALAQLPEAEQLKMLRDDMGLSVLEARCVRVGLMRLRGE